MGKTETTLFKNDPLIDLLTRCSVRIEGVRKGSGFFVGPGLVITCAHVVGENREVGDTNISVWYQGEVDTKARLIDIAPEVDDDLALLKVAFKDHPAVCLGEQVNIGDTLYAWGFPLEGGIQIAEGIEGYFESYAELPSGRLLLKFKNAEVNSGYSGGALLNRKTGRVLGVVAETRGEHSTLGGRAIPVTFVLDRFAKELTEAQDARKSYLKPWFEVAKEALGKMLSSSFPKLRKIPSHNLDDFPRRDHFIGRKEHLLALTKVLRQEGLLTLLGSGGSGKSRLAYELALTLSDQYKEGLWWVPLADIKESALVPSQLAAILKLELPKQQPVQDFVLQFLKKRKLLLILDNCEHLVPVPGRADIEEDFLDFVDDILQTCAHVTILATSRVCLDLDDETIYDLPPMKVPSSTPLQGESLSDPCESVQLFEARAKKRNHRYTMCAEEAHKVARICRSLGGLPLAIEIAAAQLKTKTVSDLLLELDQALKWKQKKRLAGERHRTVQSVIQWSYDLLPSDLKSIFLSLSVFVGGFFDVAAGALHDRDLREDLARLYERSMLMREEVSSRYRYALLEPIRQFALALLPEAEMQGHASRHATYYLKMAKRGNAQVLGPDQDAWLQRFDIDQANFRAALHWSMTHDLKTTLGLGANLWRFWEIRSHLQEGFERLVRLLEIAEDVHPGEDFRQCLSGAGLLAYRRGDAATALHYFQRVLDLERIAGESEEALLRALNDVGIANQVLGHAEAAALVYEEAITISEQSENARDLGALHFNLGKLALEQEDFEKAGMELKKSESVFREGENNRDLAFPLFLSGICCLFEKKPAFDEAEHYFKASLRLRQKAQDLRGIADCENGFGRLETLRGDAHQAKSHFKRAFEGHKKVENIRGIAETLEWLALLYVSEKQEAQAVSLAFAARHHRERGGFPAPPLNAHLQASLLTHAKVALGDIQYEKMKDIGEKTEIDVLTGTIWT